MADRYQSDTALERVGLPGPPGNIAIPRVRDFRGLNPKSFDGRGNYSMGVREQIIFPELEYDKIDRIRGLDVTITTTANTDEEGRALLSALNFPFKK